MLNLVNSGCFQGMASWLYLFPDKKEIHISFYDKYNEEIIRSVKEIADPLDVKMSIVMVSVFKTLKIDIDQNTNKIIETQIAFDQLLNSKVRFL